MFAYNANFDYKHLPELNSYIWVDIMKIAAYKQKSGRGVPTIIDIYGKDAITFRKNSIVVTIPFNRLNEVGKKVGKKVGNSDVDRPILNPRRQTILLEIKQNPYVTKHELSEIIGISTTVIDNNIAYLRNNGFIERVGKTKGGYWRITNEN